MTDDQKNQPTNDAHLGDITRLKALYRSWAIPCAGRGVYYTRHRGC